MNLKGFNNHMDKQFEILIDVLCPKQKTQNAKKYDPK